MPDDLSFLCDPEYVLTTPEFKAKTAKEVGHSLEVFPTFEKTYVIVTATHHDKIRNGVNRITCKKGMPIGGYVYDSQSDSYHVECADYLHLGYVGASFALRIRGSDWKIRVPMPESVLKKYLTSLQKKELKNFRNHFKSEDYDIQFVQMIDPN